MLTILAAPSAWSQSAGDQYEGTMAALKKAQAQKVILAEQQTEVLQRRHAIAGQYQVTLGQIQAEATDLIAKRSALDAAIDRHNNSPDRTCDACAGQYMQERASLVQQQDALNSQAGDLNTRSAALASDESRQTLQWAADMKSISSQIQDSDAQISAYQRALSMLKGPQGCSTSGTGEAVHEQCGQPWDGNGSHAPIVYQGTGSPTLSAAQRSARDQAAIQSYLDSGGVPTTRAKVWAGEPPPTSPQ